MYSIWIPRAATSAWCGRTTPPGYKWWITDIRTNTGQQLRGTALVSCQFRLDGKKVKIYTLRVSGGQLSMKHPRVMEAIAKADQLGEALRAVQAQRMRGGA